MVPSARRRYRGRGCCWEDTASRGGRKRGTARGGAASAKRSSRGQERRARVDAHRPTRQTWLSMSEAERKRREGGGGGRRGGGPLSQSRIVMLVPMFMYVLSIGSENFPLSQTDFCQLSSCYTRLWTFCFSRKLCGRRLSERPFHIFVMYFLTAMNTNTLAKKTFFHHHCICHGSSQS